MKSSYSFHFFIKSLIDFSNLSQKSNVCSFIISFGIFLFNSAIYSLSHLYIEMFLLERKDLSKLIFFKIIL